MTAETGQGGLRNVKLESADGVTTLTLNRPARRNGPHAAMIDEIVDALAQVAADRVTRVLIVTGAGGAFCSGLDLAHPLAPDELKFMRRVSAVCRGLHELPIPTIAKVRGAAVGFGANFALCCDLTLCADDAVFSEVFAERGVVLDGGGSWILPRLVGLKKAKEIAFFAEKFSGTEAAAFGLANRSVPDADLDAVVAAWATRLAAGPRLALSMIKGQLNASSEASFAASLEAEALAQAVAFTGPEAREGLRAFFEKRPAEFRPIDTA